MGTSPCNYVLATFLWFDCSDGSLAWRDQAKFMSDLKGEKYSFRLISLPLKFNFIL